MSGTFSSLTNALSALKYNRVAMDVASGNIANAGTEGYSRRLTVAQATGAPDVPALWSRWEGAGFGVEVGGVERMADPLLNARSRVEHGTLSFLDARAKALAQLETAIGEPGDTGLAAAIAAFKQGWHDVANNPGDAAARSQLLARATSVTTAFAAQASAVSTAWEDQRSSLDPLVQEVNAVADQVAGLNKNVQLAVAAGDDAGHLLDMRDQLTMRLAELTGATTRDNTDGTVDVLVGGVALVQGRTASSMSVLGAVDMASAAGDPVRVTIGGTAVQVNAGTAGAALGLVTSTFPDHLAGLDAVAASLADAVNAQHTAGYDLAGAAGGTFFTGTTAADLTVAVADSSNVAAAATPGTLDGSNAATLGSLPLAGDSYRKLVTDFGAEVASGRRLLAQQTAVTSQVDATREALSGVNLDEEMVSLLAAQRAYEGAARVMTTLDSVLDTLINRTGLVR